MFEIIAILIIIIVVIIVVITVIAKYVIKLERCPACNALVHFGNDDKCNNCQKIILEGERNSIKAKRKIEISEQENANIKYKILQSLITFFRHISLILIICCIGGIFYGVMIYTTYFDEQIKSISIIFLSFIGAINGAILYTITSLVLIFIDIEINGRYTNRKLNTLIELFKS